MLDNIALIFDDSILLMGKQKKKTYEANMKAFRENHGHYIDEMISHVENATEKEVAATEISESLCDQVKKENENKRGKIKTRKQLDLNIFMIYYIFPAILLTENENAKLICDTVVATWNKTFNTNIGYSEYSKIHESFNDKIFGVF